MTVTWDLACPACSARLGAIVPPGPVAVTCPGCDTRWDRHADIWDFRCPDVDARLGQFVREYRAVRRTEGRGGADAGHFRRLPEVPPDHPRAWEWRIRRRSFDTFVTRVVAGAQRPLTVADLGGGSGWLGARLARMGHAVVVVDLADDRRDGLGALRHQPGAGTPALWGAQAEFDRLPLAGGRVDLVVFNAAFHYSADYDRTLAEALRIMAPAGRIVVMDSPVYASRAAGEAMLRERRRRYMDAYGFPSTAHHGREYLTWRGLERLGVTHGLAWTAHRPWYGVRYALRPWVARLRRSRPPSRFAVMVGARRAPPTRMV